MKLRLIAALVCLSALLSACSLVERSYTVVEMHSEVYWEDREDATLRAESYSDLVNALMLLVEKHVEMGTVRVYGIDAEEWKGMAERACSEVQQTADGTYLLKYMTYQSEVEEDCFALRARFGYRRSAEEYAAIVDAASEEGVPELLRAAVEQGADALCVRLSYFPEDEAAFTAMVAEQRSLLGIETEWAVSFYPAIDGSGIVEILLI